MDKFDDLYEQLIMESGIATEQHVRMLMVEVFEKAQRKSRGGEAIISVQGIMKEAARRPRRILFPSLSKVVEALRGGSKVLQVLRRPPPSTTSWA
eukprot:820926-Amphidinium_carterae.1